MSWGEAFGHAIGMYVTLFVVGIVFAIPVVIGYALATDGNMAGLALILVSALAYHVCSLAIVIKGVSDAAGGMSPSQNAARPLRLGVSDAAGGRNAESTRIMLRAALSRCGGAGRRKNPTTSRTGRLLWA